MEQKTPQPSTPTPITETPFNHIHTDSSEKIPKKENTFGELLRFSFIALLIVIVVRMFIAQPFIVSGASMEHTFSTGQYLIVDQVTYRLDEPDRGDVVIFKYPNDPSTYFIKRIIGVPGDTVSINGDSVSIKNRDGSTDTVLIEPYILDTNPTDTPQEVSLGTDEYFVMGDNRNASSDSRSWGILPGQNIIGRAFLRLFPLNKVGILPGAYDIDAELTNIDID